ncbi:Mini-ribonuclease 3 [Frisingicoccus sp.]|uniref:Mini-ribonuclease 3 n=1 Tax=Frisingicoccus sp. TaxID=1918627 RepID=UPI002603D8D9|nr:ribonuclease III domain-containing protein [Frisingicoccus sp.]MDD6232084.1 ribonuclease III domain-containing protein [Frisingicoccus sp.]MDY4835553.1 ribonuclease III domain-containing protein [Frisingicoccus sp.]MDY4922274.1 ribonuclease III domain-containing protein [Frisingicoccus sp.]MDY5956281.1 ribonuclease III domain-containing protein [Frisingicoccus sp.]
MEESISRLDGAFRETFGLEAVDLKTYSPLTLAYIGDAVYELVIRSIIVEKGNAPVNKLHKRSSQLVKAKSQAEAAVKLMDVFTEEELAVYKRGRNTRSHTMAKNADMMDYRMATGFEAVMGYLHLKQDYARIIELVRIGIGDKLGE